MTQEERITTEYKRLKSNYKSLPENQMQIIDKLLQNAAFMLITLEDLQVIINQDGAVIQSTNGNGFEVIQEHPAQKSYNAMINRYTAVIKQLATLLPQTANENNKLQSLMDSLDE